MNNDIAPVISTKLNKISPQEIASSLEQCCILTEEAKKNIDNLKNQNFLQRAAGRLSGSNFKTLSSTTEIISQVQFETLRLIMALAFSHGRSLQSLETVASQLKDVGEQLNDDSALETLSFVLEQIESLKQAEVDRLRLNNQVGSLTSSVDSLQSSYIQVNNKLQKLSDDFSRDSLRYNKIGSDIKDLFSQLASIKLENSIKEKSNTHYMSKLDKEPVANDKNGSNTNQWLSGFALAASVCAIVMVYLK